MKSFRLLFLTLLLAVPAFAQQQPVSWKAEAVPVEGNTYEIRATGSIIGNWHIYDLTDYGSSGPNGTIFTIEAGDKVKLVGEPYIVSDVHKGYDDVFGIEIGTCDSPVVIAQKVELLYGSEVSVPVTVEWQACNDENCIPPDDFTMNVTLPAGEGLPALAAAEADDPNATAPGEGKSIWGLILEAIAWGFVALLTPCVFPMIPMTVSFFLKQNQVAEGEEKKKGRGKWLASIFGLSIVGLYTIPIAVIILITYFAGGEAVTADIFNWLATHWLPNIIFFLIFMIFAASFFGAFEITLPNSWLNKSDAKSNKGGLAGVFFVALTLVLVSFSCTGPIVGSVLIKSTQGGQFWEPIITMLAFSIAFAVPFTLLAFAPSLLDKLPKSGGWLNSVKVVLGFVEVALGFKFLSVADQTYHWHLLDREVYLAIWITVFTLLGLYLMGKIKFKYDSPVQHISVFRLILIIIDFTFVVWMIPGMWGAPLKGLSGYLPPITTQDFVLDPNQHAGSGGTTYVVGQPLEDEYGFPATRKYADFLHMPYDIPAFFDYEEARAFAAKVGKPILLDFTGHGCVNCREMESRVWSDPRVLKLMKNDYVVCSLFGDDKKILDKEDWVTTEDGKVLKSLGKINSYFMMKRYHVNAQPYYVILDPVTEKNKVPSRSYNLDVDQYVAFLEKGLE